MEDDVKGEVIDEAFSLFSRAPGSPKQTIEIRPKHRARVVKREEWIKADLL